MTMREIVLREHLPYVLPIVFSTTLNNINWSIGLEVTLSVLGFTDLDTPTVGTMIFWANQHSAMVSGVWWWFVFPTACRHHHLHRALPAGGLDERIHRSAQPAEPHGRRRRLMGQRMPDAPDGPVLSVESLRAYYQMKYFGIDREVRAVDDITLHVNRNEIYGLAGESSSGKTSFIKTIAAANRPPLNVVGGSVRFSFLDRDIHSLDREAARSGPVEAPLLHHAGLDERAESGPPGEALVHRLRLTRISAQSKPEFLDIVAAHLARLQLEPSVLDAYPHELSGGMRQRVTIALATICRPEFIIADEPTTALDVVVQKGVLAMIREVQREMGSSILFVTHDMAVHANMADRLGIMYAGPAGGGGADARRSSRNRCHPYTAHLIESLPRIGDVAPKKALGGTPPNLSAPPPGCRFHPRCPLAMDICRREVPALDDARAWPSRRVFCGGPIVRPPTPEPMETAA